ncbi:MAG: phosphoribosylaminoimidazolesuccinocarboxamide synthase [Saccharofermentanaceae bacterium]|nr:phosphoribosylaminoimidazolesuccinocarboxamide synthase [Clostridia bacterium]NLX68707.1 phosphoribosylaminoimidazolesuccinocarboxamide synthase [Clostridiaceae bacterium]HOO49351.1 phosphoribosylaminoimidazolesuccinocarboxamide synthase [Saccharofermentans sp.]HPE27299.1 phosphoribosylaminoimidazolesuccinocarboxamide synthase [Saccharofermentans sp.]HPQ32790.1 phosphoribosylaminoimidazolesuccinocarboxamide synthase [Saccharofermentans sp.]
MLIKDTDFIDLPVFVKGKVRNVYDLGDSLLMVVTDRISAFDVVFDELIPNKGKVLSSISAFWFDFTKDILPNHVISTNPEEYPMGLSKYKEELQGRSMLVKKVKMLPAECIVRGYLEGSALKEYNANGTVGGIKMPEGLLQGDKLPSPLFTPSTKEDTGHDINITYDQLVDLIGIEDAQALRDSSLALYTKVSEYALTKGLILADTKFEFGKIDGQLVVADEMFTPDSSRFWDLSDYQPGRAQKSFDKQYLREFLETLDWDKTYPAPKLPDDVIAKTSEKYCECYSKLTGKEIE